MKNRLPFLLSALFLCHGVAIAARLQAKVIDVTSGNTLIVSNTNRSLKVRLKGIEPPEVGQPFSDAARDHLKALVLNKAVVVDYTNLATDYLEAKVALDGVDIASQMLRDGVAWFDQTVNHGLSAADQELYVGCEQAARAEKRGLWNDPNAVSPWAFRKSREMQYTRTETPEKSFPARQSARLKSAARTGGLSNNDLIGGMMNPGATAGAANVRPIAENGTPDRWTTYSSPIGHFSITIPSNSFESSYAAPNESGQPVAAQILAGGGPNVGFFALLHFKGPNGDSTDMAACEAAIKSLIAGMNQAANAHYEFDKVLTVKSVRQLKIADYYGKQFSLHSDAISGSARVFTKQDGDQRDLFVVFTLTPPGGESYSAQFLNSFKIK